MLNWLLENWIGILAGLIVAFLIGFLFWRKAGWNKHEKGLEVFEHYHWGLVILILTNLLNFLNGWSPYAVGFGIGLIIEELGQHHPFAIKSNHGGLSTFIGIVLAIVLICFLVYQYPFL